jgi:hypothetical protein
MEYSKSVLANMGLEKGRKSETQFKVTNPERVKLGRAKDTHHDLDAPKEEVMQYGHRSKKPTSVRWHTKEHDYDVGGKHQDKVTNVHADSYELDKEKGDIRVRRAGEYQHKRIPANAEHETELKNASMDSFLNKSFENRKAMPELFKSREKDEQVDPHPYPKTLENTKDPDKVEKYEHQQEMKKKYPNPRGREMKRSYTIDEITTAQLLKGHPQAQEILDELNKSKKNESGEEFQDGSEDTIGGEGHAAVARPATVHDGDKGGDHPGTATKKESQQKSEGDADLEKSEDDSEDDVEKSDNFTDNEPEEFEDGLVGADGEDDDGDVLVSKKSWTEDELTLGHLLKTMGPERLETVIKAVINSKYTEPGALASKNNPKKENPLTNRKVNPEALKALKNRLGTGAAEKSEDDFDLEKGEGGQKEERAEWAKSPEKEKEEHMKDKSYSLDFSKSVLENMGLLEKGSPSVSKKVSGGKATQISYSDKPESRFEHPKSKEDKRYRHEPEKGEVTVRSRPKGDKTAEWKERKLDTGNSEENQKKLKNASEGDFDLHKALDAILEKKTLS